MSNVTISFDVIGSVQQELNILQEDLSTEKLIEKLNTGEYLTTLEVSHPDLNTTKRSIVYFDEEGNEVEIAEILSQTVCGDMEYTRFQLETLD